MFFNTSKQYIIIIVSVKFFFAFSCNSPMTNECNIGTLKCCNENLLNSISVNNTVCNSNSILYNINCYIQVIENIYKNGDERDLLKICDDYRKYKNCLGNAFQLCLSKSYLNSFLKDQEIVLNISSFIKQLTFICGSGLESFLMNNKCITNVFQKQKINLENCWTAFKESSQPVTICANLNSYIQCYTNVFLNNCNLESGWWSCEYVKTNISPIYPECYTSCIFS